MILGLDVSTSCTGWVVLLEGQLVDQGYIRTHKQNSLFEKSDEVERVIAGIAIKKEYLFDAVWIEQPLAKFTKGMSSANTLSKLARFNGMVSLMCWKHFALEPNYIWSEDARRALGIKVPRKNKRPKVKGKPKDTKEYVLEKVLAMEPRFELEYTSYGNVRQQCYDAADAYVVAYAGYLDGQREDGAGQ